MNNLTDIRQNSEEKSIITSQNKNLECLRPLRPLRLNSTARSAKFSAKDANLILRNKNL